MEELIAGQRTVGRKLLIDHNLLIQNWQAQGRKGGQEHDVYFTPTHAIKLHNMSTSNSIYDYINRLQLHNFYFPEVGYELIGFAQSAHGQYLPLVQQRLIDIEKSRAPTDSEIAEHLSSLGFQKPEPDVLYWQHPNQVRVLDIAPKNVQYIPALEEVFFFDPMIFMDEASKMKRLGELTA